MIKANDVKAHFASVLFAAHQFFRPNQKAIALRFLFAGVGNRISLNYGLSAFARKLPQHQAAALEGVVAFAMLANFQQLVIRKRDQFSSLAAPPLRRQRLFNIRDDVVDVLDAD